jgi:Fe-S cluster biogenesis protein NfuA
MADSAKRAKTIDSARVAPPAGSVPPTGSAPPSGSEDASFREKVDRLLARIRPAVQEDGGDLELVSARADGLVQIRLHGACIGCPSAHQTLHHGIERTLRTELGSSVWVEAVD